MAVEISTYIDVKKRIADLGLNEPDSLAVLPRNFDAATSKDELLHESSTATVRSLWRQNGIEETPLENVEDNIPYIQENAADWIGPTILVPALLLTQDPYSVTVALNVISNYLTDFLKGIPGVHTARLTLIKETEEGTYREINYKGPVEGLKDLPAILQSENSEENHE